MDKSKIRFTAMDAIIILLICVGLVALVYSILGNDIVEFFAPKHEVSYIYEADNSSISSLKVGDTLTVKKRASFGKEMNLNFGNVTSIVASPSAGKSYVTVTLVAYEADGMLFVDGFELPTNDIVAFTSSRDRVELKQINRIVLN